ncbi:hypothetical protein K2173_008933 [Erythroxylum novogranatense]|uniref:Uncharacterized protein n=1 Tax=Erythroxylum novogranatense TaxID=1862640 RepID=A0AAV8TSC8_9ROSI|nr:hypothetical protein K2173_008933 [Erythroxylum novogranatense]
MVRAHRNPVVADTQALYFAGGGSVSLASMCGEAETELKKSMCTGQNIRTIAEPSHRMSHGGSRFVALASLEGNVQGDDVAASSSQAFALNVGQPQKPIFVATPGAHAHKGQPSESHGPKPRGPKGKGPQVLMGLVFQATGPTPRKAPPPCSTHIGPIQLTCGESSRVEPLRAAGLPPVNPSPPIQLQPSPQDNHIAVELPSHTDMICDGNTIGAPPSADIACHNPMEGIKLPEAPGPRAANAPPPPVVSIHVSTLEPSGQEAQAMSCPDEDIARTNSIDALPEDPARESMTCSRALCRVDHILMMQSGIPISKG